MCIKDYMICDGNFDCTLDYEDEKDCQCPE